MKLAVFVLVIQLVSGLAPDGSQDELVEKLVDRVNKHLAHETRNKLKWDKLFTVESVLKYVAPLKGKGQHNLQVVLVETSCQESSLNDPLNSCYQPVHQAARLKCHAHISQRSYKVKDRYHVTKVKCEPLKRHHSGKARGGGSGGVYRGSLADKFVSSGRWHSVSAAASRRMFAMFVRRFNKHYASSHEHAQRRRVFTDNLYRARRIQLAERGTARYGVTKFSDLTVEEWRSQYLGLNPRLSSSYNSLHPGSTSGSTSSSRFDRPAVIPNITRLPAAFDWRQMGAVTPVKNQGQCGSCWAFSVTGNVEGQYFLKHKQLLSFSEQELVDCDTDDHGCQGGLPDNAYKFIEFLGGLQLEKEYPYEAHNGHCRLNRSELHVKLSGSVDLPKSEADIEKWLYMHGPVSIGVNANPLMFYRGGIIDVWSFLCRKSGIDHGVLLVGFGEHDYPLFKKKKPFWIVKNSWGPDWGEQGYFRMIRGTDECGVQDMASSSVVV